MTIESLRRGLSIASPEFMKTGVPEYIGREVAPMTAFEIISIFIRILGVRKDIL